MNIFIGIVLRFSVSMLLVIAALSIYGQEITTKVLTPREGLGHAVVYRIFQDKAGFIWFSTDNGITKYDGRRLFNYTAKDGLGSNFTFGTLETDTALLVASYGQGLAKYNEQANTFSIVPHTQIVPYPIDLIRTPNHMLILDRNKIIYRVTRDSVKQIIPLTQQGDTIVGVSSITETIDHRFIAATQLGIAAYDYRSNTFQLLTRNDPSLNKMSFAIVALPDSSLLVTIDDGVYRFHLDGRKTELVMRGNFHNHSQALFKDRHGNIWVSNMAGELWIVSPDFTRRERLLEGIVINHIFQDKEDNVWLATYGKGIICIPTLAVRSYVPPGGMLITDIHFDKTLHKPFVFSSNFSPATIAGDSLKSIGTERAPNVFHKRHIGALINPARDEYIAGTYAYVYRQRGEVTDSIKLGASASALYKSRFGTYWIGTRSGLSYTDALFKQAKTVPALQNRIIRAISEDLNGQIVVATDIGLFRQDRNGWQKLDTRNGLPNNYVNTIYADTLRGGCWIGTNEGVACLLSDGTFKKFDHPLATFRCNAITGDSAGAIWMATDRGLVKIKNDYFFLYNDDDGFPSDISKLVFNKSGDILYALSWDALRAISVRALENPSYVSLKPSLLISDVYLDQRLNQLKNGEILPRNVSNGRIRLSIPYFHNREQWRVRYQLNDGDWNNLEQEYELTIFNIPPGAVKITIQVIDDNKIVVTERTLKFYNPTPLYRTPWFITSAMAVVAFVLVLIIKYSTQKLAQEKELTLLSMQHQMELEHKALRNMLNPHFLNNAINSIQAFVTRNDQRSTLSYLSKFARLMRANLELLENTSVTLEKEISNIELYLTFEKLRFGDDLSYTITIDESIKSQLIKIPSLIMQPFVENAIWHGVLPKQAPGHVDIRISRRDDTVLIVIEDDGIGLIESGKRKESAALDKPSRGLSIVQNRLILLNKMRPGHSLKIVDRSTRVNGGHGTTVEITVALLY